MKYHNKPIVNSIAIARSEKALLERHYSFLSCKVSNGILTCKGYFQPTTLSVEYKYEIYYAPPNSPKVNVVDPSIPYNKDVHLYPSDESLCLYFPGDFNWTPSKHLYNTIIPWVHEWFVFYELYLLTGIWQAPSVSHTGNKIH